MHYSKKFLNQKVKVKMDRPLGAKHPKHGWEYLLNYWFVPETLAPDGEEVDAYILGVNEPLDEFEGICIAIIHRTNNDDDKLIVVSEGQEFSDEQIKALTDFQEKFFESIIVR